MSDFEQNLHRLQEAVAESDFDAVLVSSPANRFFITGFPSSDGIVLVSAHEALFATDFRYMEAAERVIGGMTMVMAGLGHDYTEIANEFLSRNHVRTLGFEDSISYGEYQGKTAALHAEFVPLGTFLTDLRRIKQPFELARLRAAQAIADEAFGKLLSKITVGISEKEIALELYNLLMRGGGERLSFSSIVVSGENGSLCHGVPSERKVKKGEFVTIDFGCVYGGYCSDTTRTVAVGEPSEEMREVYKIVLDAQTAAIAAARPGIVGRDLDAVARNHIASFGYGDAFGHGLGHGLGILCHDTDGASPRNPRVLPEGTVTTIEPGIYLAGKFGVRIEDVVILKGDGCENITHAPKELLVL